MSREVLVELELELTAAEGTPASGELEAAAALADICLAPVIL